MTTTIELVTCPDGDWEVLKVNNNLFAEGHSIRNADWTELLHFLGHTVHKTEVSNEDMDTGNY